VPVPRKTIFMDASPFYMKTKSAAGHRLLCCHAWALARSGA